MKKLAIIALSFALLVPSALSCGGGSTGGRPVALRTALAADAEIERPIETETGWTVRVDEARLSLGALYYFDGEPAFVLRPASSPLQRLAALFRAGVARAHPGHYIAGTALGQMTAPYAGTLGTEPVALAEGTGLTGLYRSARLVLSDREASDVATIKGSASKGEKTVYFELSASLEDATRSVKNGEVNGCLFDEVEVEDDGTVTVTVLPHVWLDLVEFDELAPGSAEQPTKVAQGETAQVAFALGVVQLSAYRFSYQANGK